MSDETKRKGGRQRRPAPEGSTIGGGTLKRRPFSVRLLETLRAKLEQEAAQKGVPVAELIEEILFQHYALPDMIDRLADRLVNRLEKKALPDE